MRKAQIFFCCLLLAITVRSQEFGGIPSSQEWKQIRAPRVRVIFPQGLDSSASRVADIVAYTISIPDSSIGRKFKPLSIILQQHSTISNGYVALAPYRSELLLTPPLNGFDLGNGDWLTTLTLHELRHIQQYSNFNRGLAKAFRFVLGEQGQALANALTVPDWFFEGDAVYQETLLSKQGRGRLPTFFNGYRSIWEAGLDYSYMKLRNGSYRHYIPDHYQLGYLLIAHGHNRYGTSFWKNISEDAAAMKGLFYPFQRSIKKHTSLSYRQFLEEAFSERRNALTEPTTKVAIDWDPVMNEENPVLMENGELLFIRSTYRELPVFVHRTKEDDRAIRQRDRSLDNYFSYSNGKIIYAAYRPNIRWGWQDYGELQLLDIETRHQESITKGSKYFMPSLSLRGDSIAALHLGADGEHAIHLLDLGGAILKEIKSPPGILLAFPQFYNGKILAVAKKRNGDMALVFMMQNGEMETLTNWTNTVIAYPRLKGDTIFFSASGKERDELMLLNPQTKSLEKLVIPDALGKTGIYQPFGMGDSVVFSRFTAGGYKLQFEKISEKTFRNSRLEVPGNFGLAALEASDSSVRVIPASKKEQSDSYRKSSGLFNFHSWQPFFEDPEFSFSLLGQNLLNTMQSQLAFMYNRNERSKQISFSGIYGGWFPMIGGGIDFTLDRKARFEERTINWHELEANISASIPLNLSKGRQLSFFTAQSAFVYNKPFFTEPEKSQLGDLSYLYLNHQVRYTIQSRQAVQQFNPRLALSLRGQFRHTVTQYDSWQALAAASVYLPGLSTNHSLVLNLAAQQRDSAMGIRFSDNFPFARGYESENLYRVVKWGINYQLPLLYPDKGIAQIVYLLRVRNNFFYDHAYARDLSLLQTSNRVEFRSLGSELFFDTKWWNQLPVSFGIRYSRLLDPDLFNGPGSNSWQFILPLDLIPQTVNRKKELIF